MPITGNIIGSGITITTDAAHGIDAGYRGKRIAVHLAQPNYYNQVFNVTGVPTTTTLTVSDAFSYADVANAQFTPWTVSTSFEVGERVKNGDVMYVTANAFTSGSTFNSDNLNVGKAAILTTLDHNKIKLNNTDIVLNNITSEADIVESINKAIAMRRGAIDSESQLSFAMIKGKEDKLKPLLGDYRQIAGVSPYVTADNIENTGLSDGMSRAGTMSFVTNRKVLLMTQQIHYLHKETIHFQHLIQMPVIQ